MSFIRGFITTVWILALLLAPPAASQNPFLFGEGGDAPQTELIQKEQPIVEGTTPPKIVIERVVSFPLEDATDSITLRNIGGQTQDLAGWTMTDAEKDNSETTYKFGDGKEGCEDFQSIAPSQKLEILPQSKDNPCGFEFTVGIRDEINVLDADGELQANVAWDSSKQGTSIHLMPDDTYAVLPENLDVIATLEELGNYTVLLQALEATGLKESLTAKSDPKYEGVKFPEPPPPPPIDPQFPAHFGFRFNRSTLPPPPPPPPTPPPPKEGVPKRGPYTILAPTDAAFDNFRTQLAGVGNEPISVEFMLALPELKDIILYHIIPGKWTSEYLKNDTTIITAKTAELVPFTDGAMTEGKIMLHDSCVDKPTPGGFDCQMQVDFGKCYDPFMISPLGAQWPGGFCQKTCQRCTCDPNLGSFCIEVDLKDVMAGNGVIHQVNRVMFPPPKFEPEPLVSLAESPEGEDINLDVDAPIEAPRLTIGFKPTKGDE